MANVGVMISGCGVVARIWPYSGRLRPRWGDGLKGGHVSGGLWPWWEVMALVSGS